MRSYPSSLRLFVTLLLAGATAASAQAPIGDEFRISDNHRGRARQPAVTLASNGSLVAVWENALEGLMARTVDADGQALGSDMVLVADDAEPAYPYRGVELRSRIAPALVADGSGFVLTWTEELNRVSRDFFYRDEVLLGQDVYAQRFEQGGTPVGSPVRLSSTTTLDQRPAIARLSDGNLVVVWESRHDRVREVLGRVINASGDPIGDVFTVGEGRLARVAASPAGGFLATWQREVTEDDWNIFARGFDAQGEARGAAQVVNAVRVGNQLGPQAACSGGRCLIAWQSDTADGVRLFARYVNALGLPTGSEIALSTGAFGDDHSSPTLTSGGNGNVLVLWMAWDGNFRQGVWGRFLTGNTVGAPFQVSQGVINGQFRLGAASNSQGRHLAVWEGFADDGEDALEGRFVQPTTDRSLRRASVR